MNNFRGSEWRRWDLHVHTPASYLSNEFGDPTQDAIWDTYVTNLFEKALEKEIVAIGITDYFSIEGYEKVKSYQDNTTKLTSLGFSKEKIENIRNILLLPNVELRLKCIVGTNRVNIHILFSTEVSIQNIKENFLGNLDFVYEGNPSNKDYKYKIKKINLETLGEKLKTEHTPFQTKPAIEIGAMNAVVDDADITKILTDTACFANKYMICTPVDEDLPDLPWNGQDHQVRKVLYQKSDCFFAANTKTIEFGLGKKHENEKKFLAEFKSLKPCIHGSDAHKTEDMFSPTQDRFCWIKAEPTFNGLKQILFEPEERVCISPTKPETKPDYFVIDRIKFNDNEFQTEPVFFSDKLNCIIGGKSTGKSILLHNLALTLDKKQVDDKDAVSKTRTKNDLKMTVYWADGAGGEDNPPDERKIIYIPQTYLNRLCDEQAERTEIDEIIQNIVFINDNAKKTFEAIDLKIKNYKPELEKTILDLIATHKDIEEIKDKIKDIGDKKGIETEQKKLTSEKERLTKNSDLTKDEIKKYEDAMAKIADYEQKLKEIQNDIDIVSELSSLIAQKQISMLCTENTTSEILKAQEEIVTDADSKWKIKQKELLDNLEKLKKQTSVEMTKHKGTEECLRDKIQSNKAIAELTEKIKIEKDKLIKTENLSQQMTKKNKEKSELIKKAIESIDKYQNYHKEFADTVNNNSDFKTDDLDFSVEIPFRCMAFVEKMKEQINNNNAVFKKVVHPETFKKENYEKNKVSEIIEKILSKELLLKGSFSAESAIREILSDWYEVKYKVSMGNDSIDTMSPGKKALVLLKLLIELAESKCPILIDQPEDDLDNRSVFDELIPFIRKKKKDRQIIVVTHNANIVLGADAEQVIVANQRGNNTPNKEKRFEYRTGAIENDMPVKDEKGNILDGILNKQGIQQHICDILEGGERAFELRKNKYHLT